MFLNEKNRNKNEVPEYEIKMKLKFKKNIGMSVDIAVVNTAQK